MRAQQRVGGGKLDVRDDDTDEGRYSREVGDEVENIDDQRELLAGNGGLLRRVGSWSRHGRASPRMRAIVARSSLQRQGADAVTVVRRRSLRPQPRPIDARDSEHRWRLY